MGRLPTIAWLVMILVPALGVSSASGAEILRDVDPGAGWASYRLAAADGPLAIDVTASGAGPLAFGVRVLADDGTPLVSYDVQSLDADTYATYTFAGESGEIRIVEGNILSGSASTGRVDETCGGDIIFYIGASRTISMEFDCFVGQPLSILVYGGGAGLDSRALVVSGATEVLAQLRGDRVLTVSHDEIAREASVGVGGNWLAFLSGAHRYTIGGEHRFAIAHEMWGAIGTSSSGGAIQLARGDDVLACSCRFDGGAATSGAWALTVDGRESNPSPYVIAIADARLPS